MLIVFFLESLRIEFLMKIECPKCKAFLNVDESKIPEKGVYGKCPKCQERILVKRGVGLQKLDLESELKETIGHEKEIERGTRIKKAVPVAEEKPAINDRKVRSFGSILLYGGIFLLIAVPVFFSLFNSFVQKREYQKAQEIRQKEIQKNIDIFTADSEGILKHVEDLIDEGRTSLAEKEIDKFDIPVLKKVYPEINLLKKRIYYEKLSLNILTTSLDVLRRELEGKTKDEVKALVGSPDRIQIFAGKKCWVYGSTYTSRDRGVVFHGDRVLSVTFY